MVRNIKAGAIVKTGTQEFQTLSFEKVDLKDSLSKSRIITDTLVK